MQIKDNRVVGSRELFTVVLDCGTEIKDCCLAKGVNGAFISPPSRSYEDKQGNKKWVNLAYFPQDVQNEILATLLGAGPVDDPAPEFNPDDDILY